MGEDARRYRPGDPAEARRLAALYRSGLLDGSGDERLDAIVRLAARLFDCSICLITLIDAERQHFVAACGIDCAGTPRDVAFCDYAIESDDLMVVEDAREDPRFRHNLLVTGAPFIRFYAGTPIRSIDGYPLGTLCVIDSRPGRLSGDQADLLRSLGQMVMLEIAAGTGAPPGHPERELAAAESLSVAVLETTCRVHRQHVLGVDPRKALLELLDDVARVTGSGSGAVAEVVDGARGERGLRVLGMHPPAASRGSARAGAGDDQLLALPDPASPLGRVLAGASVVVAEAGPPDFADVPGLSRPGPFIGVPLVGREGVAGILVVGSPDQGYARGIDRVLEPLSMAGAALLASLERARGQEAARMELQAFRDTLDRTLDQIFIFDEASLRFTYANRGACRSAGYSVDEIEALTPLDLQPDFTLASFRELLEPLRRGEADHVRFQTVHRSSSGRHFPVEAMVQRVEREGRAPHYVAVIRDISESLGIRRQLEWMAERDELTGLYNRAGFMTRLSQRCAHAQRNGKPHALLLIDLDRFKRLNDSSGHLAGDDILTEVARRIEEAVGDDAFIGRLAGDEFVVSLLPARGADPLSISDRVRAAIRARPFRATRGAFVTASVGITECHDGSKDASLMLREADLAMFRAKAAGRNRGETYREGMVSIAEKRQELESRLQQAIHNDELFLVYQPQWELGGRTRLVGLEALLRWRDPEHGLVSPAEFVPKLEETGLIMETGAWVVSQALASLAAWRELAGAAITVSVNVSARQLMDGDFARDVAQALDASGLPAEALELEITESALIQDPVGVRESLGTLHALGVRLALDDFGTGFSSLTHLKQFPIDTLKIDKSFVSGLPGSAEDRAIVETTLTLAAGLRRTVVAEGVENRRQLAFLRSLGCRRIQGFLLGRPMGRTAVNALLRRCRLNGRLPLRWPTELGAGGLRARGLP